MLSFSSLSISLSKQHSALDEFSDGIALAMDFEKVNLQRAIMEENTDFIVKEILAGEAMLCSAAPSEVKQKISNALAGYFGGLQVEFASSKGNAADEKFLNGHSALVVKRIGPVCEMQYTFHGGALKDEFVYAEVPGKNASQEFRIPAGYSHKASGALK